MARRRIWVPNRVLAASTAASAQARFDLLASLPGDLEAVGGLTISRIIGNVSFSPASVAVQAFAMAIEVNHESLPNTDPAIISEISGNLMWTWIGRTNGAFIETSAGTFTRIEERVYFDVRVQRKLLPNYRLTMLVQNEAGVAIIHTVGTRTLVALP